jgi:hypothetical protein
LETLGFELLILSERETLVNFDGFFAEPSLEPPEESTAGSCFLGYVLSMDWFKGKFTGKPHM